MGPTSLHAMLNIPAIDEEQIQAQGGPIGELGKEAVRNTCRFHENLKGHLPSYHICMIDGDTRQFDQPEAEQDILMILPEGKTLKLVSTLDPENDDNYILGLPISAN